MAKAVVGGVGTYGPEVPIGRGVSPLWQFIKMPPAQNSLLIKTDGSVTEQAHFDNDDVLAATTHTFILGGTRFTCDVDHFRTMRYRLRDTLDYPDPDTYSDDHQDVY